MARRTEGVSLLTPAEAARRGLNPEKTYSVYRSRNQKKRRRQRRRKRRGQTHAPTPEERRNRYESYLRSPAWFAIRKRVMERDGGLCQSCQGPASQVHHLTYERLGKERMEDLQALCASCHHEFHRGDDPWHLPWEIVPPGPREEESSREADSGGNTHGSAPPRNLGGVRVRRKGRTTEEVARD